MTVEYLRYVGPRYIHGGVTLSFDSLQPYSFASDVLWPTGDDYEAAVRRSVEQELLTRLGSLERTRVVLKRISWDTVSSCLGGFERAAGRKRACGQRRRQRRPLGADSLDR